MTSTPVFESSIVSALRSVFDAQPCPAWIVDSDGRIQAFNKEAETLLPEDPESKGVLIQELGSRLGDFVGCTQAIGETRTCGEGPLCQTCVISGSIAAVGAGKSLHRKRIHLRFRAQSGIIDYHGFVTSAPLEIDGSRYGLIIMENREVMAHLLHVIPV